MDETTLTDTTYTYTARSVENPEKVATFTLKDDLISMQLGDAILEQFTSASAIYSSDEAFQMTDMLKPVVAALAQMLLRPFPLADFNASFNEGTLSTTTWLRPGGLRLFPVSITWSEVDNPDAAEAFANEVANRKGALVVQESAASLTDYWATWIAIGAAGILFLNSLFGRRGSKN